MATHSSILAQRIPEMEETGGLQSTGSKKSDTTEATQHAQWKNILSSLRNCNIKDILLILGVFSNKEIKFLPFWMHGDLLTVSSLQE